MVRTRIDLSGLSSHAEAARRDSSAGARGPLPPSPPGAWAMPPPGLPTLSAPPPGLGLPTAISPPPGLHMGAAPGKAPGASMLRDALSKHAPPVPEMHGRARSRGSVCHAMGRCLPCQFMRSKKGCLDGSDCAHCHYPHLEMTTSAIRRAHRRVSERRMEKLAPATPDTPTSLGSDEASASSDEDPSEHSSVWGLDRLHAPSLVRGMPPQTLRAMCARPHPSVTILSTEVVHVPFAAFHGVQRL